MKRITACMMLVGAASLLTAKGALADRAINVFTPRGTAVTGITDRTPFTPADVANINAYYARTYPLARLAGNATTQYNCHSFAWYLQSTGNKVWINAPQQTKYWTDGSYRLTTSPPIGAKVSYCADDHSAIKYSASQFISKWGAMPLMIHAPGYTPYRSSCLSYYVR